MPLNARRPRLNVERRKIERRTSTPAHSPSPSLQRTPARHTASQRFCPECKENTVEEQQGELACTICGTVIREVNNIVSEITFGETSSGTAVVQGSYVGEGQRNAKTQGAHLYGAGEASQKGENSERHGNIAVNSISTHLQLPEAVSHQASRIYKLAVANNFISGRKVRVVAAAALYVASRQKGGSSPMLLVDFAEAINTNVFTVGRCYNDLKKALYLDDDQMSYKLGGGDAPSALVNIEGVIYHYATRLEFGDRVGRVANDAARVLKRMRRDWMVTGRQPNGLIGACILIAARMNNYRRTVREVVFVVKACNMTISKRLQEFGRTESSELTVEDFRAHGLRLRREAEPPVIYEKVSQEKKKRREKIKALMTGTRGNPEMVDEIESRENEAGANGELRDAEGFAIPKLPRNTAQQGATIGEAEERARRARTGESNDSGKENDQATLKRKRSTPAKTSSTQETASEDIDEGAEATTQQSAINDTPQEAIDPLVSSTDAQADTQADEADQPPPKKKRGPRKKTEEQRAIDRARRIIEPEDLGEEQELEQEIEGIMDQPSVWSTMSAVEFDKFVEDAKQKAVARRDEERLNKRRASDPIMVSDGDDDVDDEEDDDDDKEATDEPAHTTPILRSKRTASQAFTTSLSPSTTTTTTSPVKRIRKTKSTPPGRFGVSSDYEISESEFASDPEVAICTLSEADVRVKERIWTRDNEDWLRKRQTKIIQKMIQEKHDAANGGKSGGRGGVGKRKTSRGKLGDRSLIAEKGRKPKDAAEAVEWMKAKRNRPSSRIDYRMVSIYRSARGGQSNKRTASEVPGAQPAATIREESTAPSESGESVLGSEVEAIPAMSSGEAVRQVDDAARDGKVVGTNPTKNSLQTPEPTQQDGKRASQAQRSRHLDWKEQPRDGSVDPEGAEAGPSDEDVEEGEEEEEEEEEDQGIVVGYDSPDDDDDDDDDGIGGERRARRLLQDLGEDEEYADDGDGSVVFAGDREYGFDPEEVDDDY